MVDVLGKSLIMPAVTVQVPMPSGAITPALAAPAQVSLIMPAVTANIQMPVGAAAPAQAASPQNIPTQGAADSSNGRQ